MALSESVINQDLAPTNWIFKILENRNDFKTYKNYIFFINFFLILNSHHTNAASLFNALHTKISKQKLISRSHYIHPY